ncbi:hypothetical protein QFZ82_007615 [Streptomyces sp. V4I23]|uniref:hypothetical protein n=1 Tax=Streptomyces sp. V4I23 TaxID=3042282 RepID=UPI002784F4BD|nr:hypothetical protein [Streptomyces sp. V4I23]MDQ1013130.1 hypothetical protein [Streptomyces sp. V4I23]
MRHAALGDRQTLGADPADGKVQTAALRPIHKLIGYDAEHGTAVRPVAPDDAQWADFPRGYVRQEYLAWQDANDADIAQMSPGRGSDGELYEDGRLL